MNKRENNNLKIIKKIESIFINLYEKNGLKGFSINDLCKESGIAKSTFYTYFENKNSILNSIENELLDNMDDLINKLIDKKFIEFGISNESSYAFIEYIRINHDVLKALLGPLCDQKFEINFKNIIEKNFTPIFQNEKNNSKSVEFACMIFSSTIIGLCKYFIFENQSLENSEI